MNETELLTICMDCQDDKTRPDSLDHVVAVSESYFSLANIRKAENDLLPALQGYGMEYDAALQRDITRSIERLREEVDVYEKAIIELFKIKAGTNT